MAAHISKLSKALFAEALTAKIAVLKAWQKSGIPWKINRSGTLARDIDGEREVDYFPKTVAAFCKWDGSENSEFVRTAFPAIKKTNRSTLNLNHSDEQEKIDALCKQLTKLAKEQLVRSNKTKCLNTVNEEVTLLRALVEKQETEITGLRKSLIGYEANLTQRETALENTRAHYEGEVANLRKQVSDLTALARKLTPLRKEKPYGA